MNVPFETTMVAYAAREGLPVQPSDFVHDTCSCEIFFVFLLEGVRWVLVLICTSLTYKYNYVSVLE